MNIDRHKALPHGCEFVLSNPDPTVPQIVTCVVRPGLLGTRDFAMPLTLLPGGPTGLYTGQGLFHLGAGDHDPDLATNAHAIDVIRIWSDTTTTPPVRHADGHPELTFSGTRPATDATRQEGNPVDVYITTSRPVLDPGRSGSVHVEIGNAGPNTTLGELSLKFVTPFFVNLDRTVPLPDGCTVVLENPARRVPDMLDCRIPAGLSPHTTRAVDLPVTLLPGGPRSRVIGTVLVSPAANSADTETYLSNNYVSYSVSRTSEAPSSSPKPPVNLYLSAAVPAILPGRPADAELILGNSGSAPTSGPAELIYVTPFFVNIDRDRPMPEGCEFIQANLDPTIPEIIRCPVAAGLTGERTMRIPLALAPAGMSGFEAGMGFLAPVRGSADTDEHNSDNALPLNVVAIR